MRITWHSAHTDYNSIILAGDIGGTNSDFALVGASNGRLEFIAQWHAPSRSITGVVPPIKEGLAQITARLGKVAIERCCISAAGPVKDGYCALTNLPWTIDARQIEAQIGVPTSVINDFLAISYAITLLDVNDPAQVTQLPQTDGTFPRPAGEMHLIVGAGTGLGVGIVIRRGSQILAYPSEGGHTGFAPFDEESEALLRYVTAGAARLSEVEQFISGSGIASIFKFFRDVRQVPMQGVLEEINAAPDADKPALIALHAQSNPVCGDSMRLFVKLYARVCSDLSTVLLPSAGVYLAGGIAAKNEKHFTENRLFMRYFSQNFRPAIADMLRTYPVYLVRNYSSSLLGAAQAALQAGALHSTH